MKASASLLTAITLSFASIHQAVAQVSFAPAINYAVGNSPGNVVAVDVNGDGKLDLICPNWNDGTLSILTNNGSSGFGSNAIYTVGSFPTKVVAADVNGDGKVDLICANSGDSTLLVLTNNGLGGFGSNATYTVGNYATCVVAADVNGDGKMDLICAGGSPVVVLTNNGSGGFVTADTYLTNGADWVIAADVNSDGKMDLICAHAITLSVLTNNGSGGFALGSTLRFPSEVTDGLLSATVADLTGDGNVSLITASEGLYPFYVGQLSVFTNNGSGSFALASSAGIGLSPWSVAVADVNGDGKMDLICVTTGRDSDGTLSVLTNNGSGGFEIAGSYDVPNGAQCVIAADVNGDGKMDLICTGDKTLSVFLNTSIFPRPTSTPTLTIHPQSNDVCVSWPLASAGWSLQQNSDLTTTNWSPSGYNGYVITEDGTNQSLKVPSLSGSLFFRLLHP